MSVHKLQPAPGRLLISEPSLQDTFFRKAVVLIAEHNDEGSFGLIINKPVNVRLPEVVKDLKDFDVQLFLGGPVKTDSLFFIHTKGEKIEGSMKILKGIFWGGDLDQVREMMKNGEIGPNDIRFFIGYSGWTPNQLEQELEINSWIVVETTKKDIIGPDPENMWQNIIMSMGNEYQIWANFPPDPAMN